MWWKPFHKLQGCTIYKELKKAYTAPAQIKNTLKIQPAITYAQITKQSHQQTTDIEDENIMKSLFEQIGTMLNLLTTMLTKL
jgi:hypothetical protein